MAWRLSGVKPLFEPILEYCLLHPWEQTWVKSQAKFMHFHTRNCIRKCRLQNANNYVSASMCQVPSNLQYIPRNMHTLFALLCFVVVIRWLIFPYPSGLLHCPSASKATLMNIDKYFMWIHYEQLHNHNKAKHIKTVCIFLGIYCRARMLINDTHILVLWM